MSLVPLPCSFIEEELFKEIHLNFKVPGDVTSQETACSTFLGRGGYWPNQNKNLYDGYGQNQGNQCPAIPFVVEPIFFSWQKNKKLLE